MIIEINNDICMAKLFLGYAKKKTHQLRKFITQKFWGTYSPYTHGFIVHLTTFYWIREDIPFENLLIILM